MKKLNIISLLCLLWINACSPARGPEPSLTQDALIGSVAGVVIGAGTGAAIGSSISDGDTGESALLGAAIGLPVGAILGTAYHNYERNKIISDNQERIDENTENIKTSQEQIDAIREELRYENSKIEPDPNMKGRLYLGPRRF